MTALLLCTLGKECRLSVNFRCKCIKSELGIKFTLRHSLAIKSQIVPSLSLTGFKDEILPNAQRLFSTRSHSNLTLSGIGVVDNLCAGFSS